MIQSARVQHSRRGEACRCLHCDGLARYLSRPDIVAPSTRLRVLKAVEHLGYTPNSAAKHLRTRRSGKILVMVPDISNPFFSLILQGIEDAAQREGYAVLVGDTQHDANREERYALMLRRKEADGLIFLGHRLPKVAAELVPSMAPLCAPVVNGCEFSPALGVPGVHIDNNGAAVEAMEHLYLIGHRRIGVITGPLESPLERRSSVGNDDVREEPSRGRQPDGADRRFFDRVRLRGGRAAARPSRAADRDLLLQRRDGDRR